MAEKRYTYYRGVFKGKYSGTTKLLRSDAFSGMNSHDIKFHAMELSEIEECEKYDSRLSDSDSMELDFIKDAHLILRSGEHLQSDLLNVILRNVDVKDVVVADSRVYGTLSADIYACRDHIEEMHSGSYVSTGSTGSFLEFLKTLVFLAFFLILLMLLWRLVNKDLGFSGSEFPQPDEDVVRVDTVYVKEVDTLRVRDTIFRKQAPIVFEDSTYVLNTGDVNITLFWQTKDDLDLHVITPDNQWIYHGNKQGRLDSDKNSGEISTCSTRPVENYYHNESLSGAHEVYVCYYSQNKRKALVDYSLRIKNENQVSTFRGNLEQAGNNEARDRGRYLSSVHCDYVHSFVFKKSG